MGQKLCTASCRGDRERMTKTLIDKASPVEKICALSEAEDAQTLEYLLRAGVDINLKTNETYSNAISGQTALHWVIDNNRKDLFDALIRNHIDVNAQDDHRVTPLMKATELGREEMVEDLLKAGALPNLKDRFGDTALCMAQHLLFGRNAKIVEALKEAGGTCK
jgi:ankyrin repeat protein